EAEAVAMPVQCLDLVALTVHKHEQRITKQAHLQLLLDQRRQSANGLPEVHWLPTQVDAANAAARMHQRTCWQTAAATCASQAPGGNVDNSNRTPGASHKVQRCPMCGGSGNCTATSCATAGSAGTAACAFSRLRQ